MSARRLPGPAPGGVRGDARNPPPRLGYHVLDFEPAPPAGRGWVGKGHVASPTVCKTAAKAVGVRLPPGPPVRLVWLQIAILDPVRLHASPACRCPADSNVDSHRFRGTCGSWRSVPGVMCRYRCIPAVAKPESRMGLPAAARSGRRLGESSGSTRSSISTFREPTAPAAYSFGRVQSQLNIADARNC